MCEKATLVCGLALKMLNGYVTKVEPSLVEDVLAAFDDMGGIKLEDSPQEIVKKAKGSIDNAEITFMVVNRIGMERDVVISFILNIPDECPASNTDDLFSRGGYALAYCYNVSATWCSEHGDIFLERQDNGAIVRVG